MALPQAECRAHVNGGLAPSSRQDGRSCGQALPVVSPQRTESEVFASSQRRVSWTTRLGTGSIAGVRATGAQMTCWPPKLREPPTRRSGTGHRPTRLTIATCQSPGLGLSVHTSCCGWNLVAHRAGRPCRLPREAPTIAPRGDPRCCHSRTGRPYARMRRRTSMKACTDVHPRTFLHKHA